MAVFCHFFMRFLKIGHAKAARGKKGQQIRPRMTAAAPIDAAAVKHRAQRTFVR